MHVLDNTFYLPEGCMNCARQPLLVCLKARMLVLDNTLTNVLSNTQQLCATKHL